MRDFSGNKTSLSRVHGVAHLTRVPNPQCGRVLSVAKAAWALVLLNTLIVAGSAFGTPSLSVTPDSVTVGDQIRVTILTPDAQLDEISWPTFPENRVGDLMLLRADTLADRRAMKQLGGPALMLTTAAFDTGTMDTGELWVVVKGDTTRFDPRQISVSSVLADSAGDFAPLKAQEDLRYTFSDMVKMFGPWIIGIGLLLLLWTFIQRWLAARRRRAEMGEEMIPLLSPYEEAKQALQKLREENPLAHGDQKGYVSSLGQISKRLLERAHMRPVLEMTTWEVRRWLNDTRTLCDGQDLLSILEAGDHVKFAKGALDPKAADTLMASAERIVESYIPRPETPEGGTVEEDSSPDSIPEAINSEAADAIAAEDNEKPAAWRTHTASAKANQGRRS